MGASVSRLTREEVQRKTQNYSQLYSFIFQFMLEKLKIEDLTQLHNGQKCGEYIVFMGNVLMDVFYKLQIEPARSEKGTIYFKKADELKKAMPDGVKLAYCQQIAFFYIRIFQIYAALALSVLDEAGGPLGAIASSSSAPGQGAQFLGARPVMRGGDNSSFFGKLISTMGKDTKKGKFLSKEYYILHNTEPIIYIVKNTIIVFHPQAGIFELVYDATLYKNSEFVITINKLSLFNNRTFLQQQGKIKTIFGEKYIPYEMSESVLNDLSDYILRGLESYLQGKKKEIKEINYAQYFPTGVPGAYAAEPYRYAQAYQATPIYPGATSVSPQTDPRDTRRFIEAFKKTPRPQPYCMGRALQLLKSEVLKGAVPLRAYTSVCSTSYRDSSVPSRDGQISTSLGLGALATLFYDTLQQGTPQLSSNARTQYIQFLKNMAILFNDNKESKPDFSQPVPQRDILWGIKSRTPTACPKEIRGDAIVEDKGLISDVMKKIQDMFNIQIAHAAAAQKIIIKLFVRTSDGQIYLTDAVKNGGIPYLNKVAEEARELLIKYYINCEGNYAIASHLLAQKVKPIS